MIHKFHFWQEPGGLEINFQWKRGTRKAWANPKKGACENAPTGFMSGEE